MQRAAIVREDSRDVRVTGHFRARGIEKDCHRLSSSCSHSKVPVQSWMDSEYYAESIRTTIEY